MFRIINRVILVFSILMIALGIIYVTGNMNGYSDETLSSIVYLDMLFSLVQAILIATAIIYMIVTICKTKSLKHLLCLLHYLASFIIMALSLSLSSILNYLK